MKPSDKMNILERLNWLGSKELADDIACFYPPAIPLILLGNDEMPITNKSSLEHRMLVWQLACAFQTEGRIMYKKPDLQIQFCPFQEDEFNSWILLARHLVLTSTSKQEENLKQQLGDKFICEAVGICHFYKDSRLTPEQKKESSWVAGFAWVHPFHRRSGALSTVLDSFKRYGNFWIEGPVSEDMDKICKSKGIDSKRILSPTRNAKEQECDLTTP